MKEALRKFICFMNGSHEWVSKERFHSEDGISGVPQYKIVCEKCGKGNEKEWEYNNLLFIVKD